MRHNGIAFPPEYAPRGLSTTIRGKLVKLEPLQEEMLMAWAKKIGTPYVDDPVFQENFLYSLCQAWPQVFAGVRIDDLDWTEMVAIAQSEKLANLPEEKRKELSAQRKLQRAELQAKYGHARVDDHQVEIGAYLIEPPGIFMGRGAHPLRGRWKPRVYSHQVTLNLDEDADVPAAPHGRWAKIVHEHDSLWIARWLETLTAKVKYVWLAETSHLRQERERAKYDKAWTLAEHLREVRAAIRKGMRDRAEKKRQVATVAYLIDRLAMRVGDEKDEDEADTVGASTLRVEHVNVRENQITFDFLGKDSVRWEKTLRIEDDTDRALAENLKEFERGKAPGDQLFPDITSARVNDFLKSVMPGLSAKVFRTYHATTTVDGYLDAHGRLKKDATDAQKEYVAKMANLQAAVTCNHKRTPPKTWAESLEKRAQGVEKLRAAKPDLAKLDAAIQLRQAALDKVAAEQKAFAQKAPDAVHKKQAARAALQAQPAPTDEQKLKEHTKKLKRAEKAARDAEKLFKQKTKRYKDRVAQAHHALLAAQDARKRAETHYRERLERAELQLKLVRETKDYALNTSLKNYIDPRVYRDWGERVGYDWKKLYTGALQRKFTWAMRDDDDRTDDAEQDE
ncbi:MAG: DNA topoisomerase I [Chloroflexi bacterium]|nr:DNA topoisomerase I [Chloroflexota bacterium]